MGKIEEPTPTPQQARYARVMQHIGGHNGGSSTDDMIRGGEDFINLLDTGQLDAMHGSGVDIERLISLGALRAATPEEVNAWEVSKGLAQPTPAASLATFVSQHPGLQDEMVQDAGAPAGDNGGIASAGHTSYKGMTKGELSEYTVPELKDMAKGEAIEGYEAMLKPALLDALLAVGK